MKQIKVNDKCFGCGLCIVNSPYLEENTEGNAEPIPEKAIKSEDIDAINRVIMDCPVGALEIVKTETSNKGKAGVNDVISSLSKKCEAPKIKAVERADVKLNIKNHPISVPYSTKDSRYEYPSEGSAKSAARDEFNRLCYSETAYRPLIKKVFVEYKVNVLKPYYNCQNEPESVYYKYNEMIRKYLADAYAEICSLVRDNKLPSNWKDFSVYLSEKDWSIEALMEFDERSTASGSISSLKDTSYTAIDDYVSDMDFDYMEEYVGEGLFGSPKYKNKWCFTRFDSAAKSYIDDLSWAIGYMSYDIEDGAIRLINSAFETFEEKIKQKFSGKIDELKNIFNLNFKD